jgi:hypothetical protein
MFASESYWKKIDRIRKNCPEGLEDKTMAVIREAFFFQIKHLPSSLRHSLFNHYVERFYERADEYKDFFEVAYFLGGLVDLFNKEYDEEADPLAAEDWSVVRDLVNESAPEMDLETLTYVMRLLLSKGHVGS